MATLIQGNKNKLPSILLSNSKHRLVFYFHLKPLLFLRCAIVSHPAPGSKNNYFCDGMEGRFINIVIPGKTQSLTLCEVEITGQPTEKPAPAGD